MLHHFVDKLHHFWIRCLYAKVSLGIFLGMGLLSAKTFECLNFRKDEKQHCSQQTLQTDFQETDWPGKIAYLLLAFSNCVHKIQFQTVKRAPYWPLQDRTSFTSQVSWCHSLAKSCPTLWNPMDCSMPRSSILHYFLEFAQIHVHWISDAI